MKKTQNIYKKALNLLSALRMLRSALEIKNI